MDIKDIKNFKNLKDFLRAKGMGGKSDVSEKPRRTKRELDRISELSCKEQMRKLSDAEKAEFYELCYNREPEFPHKDVEKERERFGEIFGDDDW